MSKAVLISIRPKWCDLIANGKKTVEIRKTRPKLETPFKCYIYQTLPKSGDWNDRDGRVIGEFVCDGIQKLTYRDDGEHQYYQWLDAPAWAFFLEHSACLTHEQIKAYLLGKTGYGLHISDLVIYDKPKQLSEFYRWYDGATDIRPCENGKPCEHEIYDYGEDCQACAIDFDGTDCPFLRVTRPPQSWCYVEEL